MKKTKKWMFAAIVMLCGAMTVQSAQDEKNGRPYFTSDELPNIVNFLPPPPDFESARFVPDQSQYLWGKLQRLDPDRAAMAQRDAVFGMQTIIDEFGSIFGLNVTKEDTPELYTLLQDVGATCDSAVVKAKKHYMRLRPYVYYEEGTLVPEKEEKHRGEGSYPSGHTCLGWTMALLLSDINPAAADALLNRGYEFGQSRVIAGYHWQSDVDAARVAASILYIKLKGNTRFCEQFDKARQEFVQKTGGTTGTTEVRTGQPAAQARVYSINGTPATTQTRGVLVQHSKKTLRP